MKTNWLDCKSILILRPDNMGDLIMSGPAIRALKTTFCAKITLLTSSAATPVAELMDEVDEVITFDFPWVKNELSVSDYDYINLVEKIRLYKFDAAVLFTVYSQNPLPTIMLAYLAGIPRRLAYCRENPYHLLTDWVPDPEPYTTIRHQVKRDLDLVKNVGAVTLNDSLYLKNNISLWPLIETKLKGINFQPSENWLILHAGVSEKKRAFSNNIWVETAKLLVNEGYQVLLTGSVSEKKLTDELQQKIGKRSFSAGGMFNLSELVALINKAPVLITVNTGTVHIAAAVKTPVVVLYALTNPQHTPWKVPNRVLPYQVTAGMHSNNEIIKYVNKCFCNEPLGTPNAQDIVEAAIELIANPQSYLNNELCLIEMMHTPQAGYKHKLLLL